MKKLLTVLSAAAAGTAVLLAFGVPLPEPAWQTDINRVSSDLSNLRTEQITSDLDLYKSQLGDRQLQYLRFQVQKDETLREVGRVPEIYTTTEHRLTVEMQRLQAIISEKEQALITK